jgi:lipoate-protein ligase A
VFSKLDVYSDDIAQSAAMNMAIDEALLESATVPSVRFYRWQSPALSFGYFGRFRDVANCSSGRDVVRRWTGGGIVLHGQDLTYSIVFPASHAVYCESSTAIYEKIHRALCEALNANGERAVVAAVENRCSLTSDCFANPVRADVMVRGRKVAGAAQRRTRRGLLQQGSIQGINVDGRLAGRFAGALSINRSEYKISEKILDRARELAEQKYGTHSWLHKR